jgi:hypothetical protein
VPDRRSIFRLLALAGFLLTVALALWLAELRPLVVIIVMAIALLVAWAIEWFSWRQDVMRVVPEGPELDEELDAAPAPPPFLPPAAPMEAAEPEAEVAASVAVAVATSSPEPELPMLPPAPVEEPEQAAEGPAPAAEPEPEPEAKPVAEPVPVTPAPDLPRPSLVPVPSPPPVEPAGPRTVEPAAAAPAVIDMRTRVTTQPRRWNLWDLERRAREEAQRDPLRHEEWSYLFVHLRQFATPDGSLPTEFDGLVRESFGELLEHAG